jgi:type II secretory pathway pseudopilin PulG
MPCPQQQKRPGYTFLEVTIVVVMLGVMTSLVLPRVSTASRSLRVAHAANVVAADMELVSAMAAQRRSALELRMDLAAPGYRVVTRDSGRVVLTRTLGAESEWRLRSAVATPAVVTIFPGGTWSSNLRLVLSEPGHDRTVTVTRAGLVRVLP